MPILKELLSEIGKTDRIDLFLYSRGGATNVPWKVVSLLREYCEQFSVLIPFRAHSAATMIALGADEIVCGPAAELGPIDPSLTTPFNPRDPRGNPIPISVEAINSFLDLLRERIKFEEEESVLKSFEILCEKANPLTLGEIYRQHNYIRMVAKKLMQSWKEPPHEEIQKSITKALIEEMYYHGHAITRKEAKEIGLKIVDAKPELEKVMWDLLEEYSKEMELLEPFEPFKLLKDNNFQVLYHENICVSLETATTSFSKIVKLRIEPQRQMPQNLSFNMPLLLPPNILELIEKDQNSNKIINDFYQQLIPKIKQKVVEELNRQAPIVDVNIKRIEEKWVKL